MTPTSHTTETDALPASHAALRSTAIGSLQLTNCLAVAPMTRVSAEPDGTPTEEMADYYEEFAAGGFGLIITEGVYTDASYSQGYLNQPGLVSQAHVSAWGRVVSAVHSHGVPIVAQLMHAGALSQGNGYGHGTIAPSPVSPKGRMLEEYGGSGPWPIPREATESDIAEVFEGFTGAAANAHVAGFDGVEVHAANGYLLDQFLTDYTNQRSDRYGGSLRARVRFAAEVVTEVVSHAPTGFLVGVRLSQTKVNDFTHRWSGGASDAATIFEALAETGIDYLHVASEGRDFIQTAKLDDGRTITGLARDVTGLPVIANGGMHDLNQAADVLNQGHADLLSLGRGALANPDLPRRLREGRALHDFDHALISPRATIANSKAQRGLG